MAEFKPKVWMTCPLCEKQSPMPDPDHREWKGLTEPEIIRVAGTQVAKKIVAGQDITPADWIAFGRAIEAKLKEKNHG